MLALTVVLSPASIRADQAPTVEWSDSWPRFRLTEGVATGALIGGTLWLALGTDFKQGGERGENFFDTGIRDALRMKSRAGRDRARTVGDVGFRGMALYPYVVDTLAVAWIGHGSSDVAAQMFLINTESFALAAFLSVTGEHALGRARPSTDDCERDPDYERFCDGADEYASFPSGHTAIAATGAGLVCLHHQYLPLYGGGVGDGVACVTGVGVAAATALARVANDRHWGTDVLTGAAIGVGSGYLLPLWLHYSSGTNTQLADTRFRWTVVPIAMPNGGGARWAGIF